ncbi:hypothetical protein RI129_006722 [Pyrocoelia pectoralis]|uniref:Coiled-coil domain-containing protein n=1 Tax=Pyrocoelia pectoralis TaxID=417401 RepID=A0AAN7ZIR3_9COLE
MSTESIAQIRRFMNGAVSIESVAGSKASQRMEKPRKRVSCSCSSGQLCEIHENMEIRSENSAFSLTDEVDLKSITTESTPNLLDSSGSVERDLVLQSSNKKIIKASQTIINAKKEEENRLLLEKQRKNFQRWLANKRKEEEEKERIVKEKITEKQNEKVHEKKHRNKESELKYKLWCKRKEQEELEKKLKDKINEIKASEEEDQRKKRNETAYKNWLKNSVYKPVPIPLNRGLDTLRSSASVAYINPIPWQSNIDENCLNSSK